jgi:hypothetical protein
LDIQMRTLIWCLMRTLIWCLIYLRLLAWVNEIFEGSVEISLFHQFNVVGLISCTRQLPAHKHRYYKN